MGASNSRMEDDKAVQLCRERKKLIRQALDGRCSLAATHIAYIEALKITGTTLRKFIEPEAPIESSMYTSTIATPEPLALTEKSLSEFSFSSPTRSHRVDATLSMSPSPSPPPSRSYQADHMKFRGPFARKVEEQPSIPVIVSVSSSTPKDSSPRFSERPQTPPHETPVIEHETAPWDYFGLSHPIDSHFSTREGKERMNASDVRHDGDQDGNPESEYGEGSFSSPRREESEDSEDEFDEPSTPNLVRTFENVNRATDRDVATGSVPLPSVEKSAPETKFVTGDETKSPDLSPLRSAPAGVTRANDLKAPPAKENDMESKVAPKDFFSSIKEIEYLFSKASESGREVPRMLEANKFHFRPILPGKEGGSTASTLLKSCFSCGEDPSHVQEDPPQTSVKYLTWHRTTSSRSASSRNLVGGNSVDDIEEITNNLFDNFSMISGSHASTLDRVYAWEKKLYDEVKASKMVRSDYDRKCRLLRQLESKGVSTHQIDKKRAVVKDLHTRIRVAIYRIDSISRKIEDLRDKELQPQLEELIEGLRKMWEVMSECHNLQLHIVSISQAPGLFKINFQSDARRQITLYLENELSVLSSSFTKWIGAQRMYVEAINKWLFKCVLLQQKAPRRKRRIEPPPLRNYGPPIYVLCGLWLDKIDTLPTNDVVDSMKSLASEITHFLPHHEKNQGGTNANPDVNILRGEALDDRMKGLDHLRTTLTVFLGRLSNFADSSVKMYTDLQRAVQEAKSSYEQKSGSS